MATTEGSGWRRDAVQHPAAKSDPAPSVSDARAAQSCPPFNLRTGFPVGPAAEASKTDCLLENSGEQRGRRRARRGGD